MQMKSGLSPPKSHFVTFYGAHPQRPLFIINNFYTLKISSRN